MNKNITNEDIVNGSFVVPEGATKIDDYAFDGCKNLKSIIIPESVTEIGEDAFDWCTGLKKVSLPKKVKFNDSVFHRCHPDLKIVYRD